MIPRPMQDNRGTPIRARQYNLTDQNILRALGYVAEYIRRRGKTLTLVAVGGAINTILLRTRTHTHDVDILNNQLSGSEVSLMREAVQYAIERSSVQLGDKWLNNETGTIGGTHEQVPRLIELAGAQNDIVFRQQGLTVLEAPWHYAFVTKVGRITQGTGRSYDWDDAIVYIHEHIRRHRGQTVAVNEIHGWGRVYRRNTLVEILQEIDQRYDQRYGTHAIRF